MVASNSTFDPTAILLRPSGSVEFEGTFRLFEKVTGHRAMRTIAALSSIS
jgi:hypothetical protein